MAMCPLGVDWGNVADWAAVVVALAAAVATFLAVLVAIRSSSTAIEEARRQRAEDRAAKKEEQKEAAKARAIVIDHELYMLGGEIRDIADKLSEPSFLDNPHAARVWMIKKFPTDPLPMLSRFAGDLDAFGAADAGKLLRALSSLNVHRSFLHPNYFEDFDDQQAKEDMEATVRSLRIFQHSIRVARELTHRWATDGKLDLAESDF